MEALAATLRSTPAPEGSPDMTIGYRIGDVSYRIVAAGGTVHLDAGEGPADVTLTIEPETARQLAAGTMPVADALRHGSIRVRGDVRKLQAAVALLAAR